MRAADGVQGVEPPKPTDPPVVAAHAAPPPVPQPGLASVVFRAAQAQAAAASPAAAVPAGPLATAVRQAVTEPPAAVRKQQAVAETIVEDYASKQRLGLPAAIAVYHERSGAIAEQYRRIRQRLMEANPKREPTSLVITSSRAGEGKTVTTVNLGLSLVEVRANRVLLIDGDLHAGALSRVMRLDHEMGLAEAITAGGDAAAVDAAVKATPWHNLFVLPSGAKTPPAASAELLKLPAARNILREVRKRFDWVLIDAPAAGAFPDAGVLGASSDGLIVAVSLRHTPREEVQTTLRRLSAMNLPVKGCILTRHEG
jgi:capsular exopolysaccharide synthesis family protein